jgi:exopolysaccharide biosynthesis polyprenyl glycosylphosphotransferase
MTQNRKITFLLLLLDVVSVFAAFHFAGYLRGLAGMAGYPPQALAAPLCFLIFALYLIDGYKPRTDMMSLDYTSLHVIALFSAMIGTLLLTYVIITEGFSLQSSRVVILGSFAALVPVTLSYRRALYRYNLHGHGRHNLIFFGDRPSCLAFREECQRNHLDRPVVFCVAGPEPAQDSGPTDLSLQPFAQVLRQIKDGALAVEAIVLRESNLEFPLETAQQLVEFYFGGVPTYTLELFHQLYWRKIPLYRLNQTWLFQEGFQIAREPVFERLKRVSDLGFAVAGLIVFSPLILGGAVAVWLQDHGPIFFRQRRIGKNHVPFEIVKLRTMRVEAPSDDPYTHPGDARVTRVGRFLRATRIDELPQLWNVLRGDMSLIGPRAEWDRLVFNYERQIPCYHFRHLVKPGITGWAQVNYPYGANLDDTLRKLEYDLYYIRHFSFALDAAIVLKTIHVMVFGKGR